MALNVISKTRLEKFWAIHEKAEGPLTKWYNIVRKANWTCFADVKLTYRSVDKVNDNFVFDVSGYRVVASIVYVKVQGQLRTNGRVYIKEVFTHSEYDQWTKGQR